MFKLIEGYMKEKRVLYCPHCDNHEEVDLDEQFEDFDCLHVTKTGCIQAWLCRVCEKPFYIELC